MTEHFHTSPILDKGRPLGIKQSFCCSTQRLNSYKFSFKADQIKMNSLEWLNQTYVEDMLKRSLDQANLKVLEVEIKPATAAGDNYASEMLRVRVMIKKDKNSDQENLNLITKLLVPSSFSEVMKEFSIFQKEAEMFINILPAIDKLLKRAYPEHEAIQAECYGFDRQHRDAIFFQDLRDLGFRMCGQNAEGMDRNHTDLALKSLAKYHAASLIHLKDHPEVLQTLRIYDWNVEKALEMIGPMYKNARNGYTKLVKTWPDGPKKEKFLEKINLLDNELMNRAVNCYARDDSVLNMLTHGDCWINNMMFKYEGSKPTAIKWVDFQVVNYNSPVIDLVYFIFTSQPDEVRYGDHDSLLRTYHDAFTETLERLNFALEKPFTFEDLKNEYNRRLIHGVYALLIIYPITVCPPSNIAKIDDFMAEDGGDVSHLYTNEIVEKALIKGFEFFEKHGVF